MTDNAASSTSLAKRSRPPDISQTEEEFRSIGISMMRREKAQNKSEISFLRRWKEHFGIRPRLIAHIWDTLLDKTMLLEIGASKKHLLWALMFLRLYLTEKVNCSLAGCLDEGTFRGWCWRFIDELAALAPSLVSLSCVSLLRLTTWIGLDCLGKSQEG